MCPRSCLETNWQTENLFEDLAPGAYTIYVTYPNGCVFDVFVEVLEVIPPELEVTIEQVSCPAGEDGMISIEVLGSTCCCSTHIIDDSEALCFRRQQLIARIAIGLCLPELLRIGRINNKE